MDFEPNCRERILCCLHTESEYYPCPTNKHYLHAVITSLKRQNYIVSVNRSVKFMQLIFPSVDHDKQHGPVTLFTFG